MSILNEVQEFVEQQLTGVDPSVFYYHNIAHTKFVVDSAREIAENSNIEEDELEMVLISAWFHDLGYVYDFTKHEEKSIEIARKFLTERKFPEEKIKQVERAIWATKMPQKPTDKISEILCDADMAHLPKDDFIIRCDLLRKEFSALKQVKIKKNLFCDQSVEFMNAQDYFTDYARKNFKVGKMKNMELLKDMANEKIKKAEATILKKDEKIRKLEEKLAKKSVPERGIESMFRMTGRSQINLSAIADNKANILITVNSIIISILATYYFRLLNNGVENWVPATVLILTALLTIIYAILSTRPKISSGRFTRQDIEEKKVNLMFFGNFYNMSLEEYDWAVKEMMKDYNGLYSNMIMDQYILGKVLAVKYKRIRMAYNIFMIGLIAFVFSLIIVHVF